MSSPKPKRHCTHSVAGDGSSGKWHDVLSGMDLDLEGITKCLLDLDPDTVKVSRYSFLQMLSHCFCLQ